MQITDIFDQSIIDSLPEYSVRAYCSNCHHTGHISAKKGEPIPGTIGYECPVCKCNTFKKGI